MFIEAENEVTPAVLAGRRLRRVFADDDPPLESDVAPDKVSGYFPRCARTALLNPFGSCSKAK